MRILLVTQRFRPLIGGAESVLWELARELVRQRHAVGVVTARWDAGWSSHERVDGVEIYRLPLGRIRFLGTWRFMRVLRNWLLGPGRGYDLWYVSMLKHCAWTAVGASWRCRLPVVLRPEGAGASGDVAWAETALAGRWIQRRCRQATAFVAIGQHVRHELEHAQFPSHRIHDIPNGVPVPPDDDADKQTWRQRLGLEPGPLVVYIGRLSPEKGIADLLAAWRLMHEQLPQSRLALVGSGPQEGELRGLAHALPGIVWVGATTQPQRYLRAADLFVLPSHQEGMSIALLEAMAAAVPIIATDIPGNRALIESGHHGLLVPAGKPESLAKAMSLHLQAKGISAAMARAARERVQDEFSITTMAQRHAKLFESLLA